VQHGRVADRVPLLREEDDVRSGRGRPRHEPFRPLEVRGLVGAARELDAGNADPVGHRPQDSFAHMATSFAGSPWRPGVGPRCSGNDHRVEAAISVCLLAAVLIRPWIREVD